MITDNELRIRGKILYFYEEQLRVHVKRVDKTFWNGKIVAVNKEGVYTFIDDKLGECLLFASDVYEIEEFKGAEK